MFGNAASNRRWARLRSLTTHPVSSASAGRCPYRRSHACPGATKGSRAGDEEEAGGAFMEGEDGLAVGARA